MAALVAITALLGLAIGSFLNVAIYRVPRQLSVISPGSRCPSCDLPIRNRHNVPIFGWLLLRGRCKDCRTPISIRYPTVELLTGVLFALIGVRTWQLHWLSALPAYLYFAAIAVALAIIDIEVHRLPDAIVLPSYPILALLLTMAAVINDNPVALLRAAIGGLLLYGFYFLLHVVYPGGMGFGDVKLSGLLGCLLAFVSWQALAVGSFLAFLIGGILGIAVLAVRRGGRKTMIPFGPFMLSGAMLAIFAANPLSTAYLHLLINS
jgi:leader peptidase (prepilin peptidase)/N-methyltransferase